MLTYQPTKRCTAHVTLKKGRVKEYNGREVFLKDGQEFEIELYNPHQKSVLAKISINGIYISGGGIVLRPGQRVFLERYLDKDKKFKFSTYEVENTKESQEAIANNGNIKVEFYFEQEPPMWWGGSTLTIGNFGTGSPTWKSWTTDLNQLYNGFTTTSNSFYCSTNINEVKSFNASPTLSTSSLETGRIEAGSKSDQKFQTVNEDFCSWYSESVEIKIKPFSAKPVEVSEIRNYCTSCSTRIKKSSWKFCPSCGESLEG